MKNFVACLFVFILASASVSGDEYSSAYLEFKQTSANDFDVLWKVPANITNKRENLRVQFPTDALLTKTRRIVVAGVLTERSSIHRAGGLAGATIEITGLGEVATDVLVRIERLDGSSETARLQSTSSSFVVLGAPQFMDVVNTYVVFGIEHILTGFDHLMFVACLIFIAGVSANRWRRLLLTITGFTVAHSVTLTLAALEWVRMPILAIEASIALSIVFLAREIMVERRDTLTWRYPLVVSATFGLLHGFGFASALREIGLPKGELATALLTFNIGVEIGQILFVLCLILLFTVVSQILKSVKMTSGSMLRMVEKPVALGVGCIAMFWTLERLSGVWV
ncbi:MAG: HupE/UreJ family protein [Spongiibacteraceae bacterium]|nr:HupE/UreJ family protein [Spongiibacteraceae bacterium]MBN4055133.1 HupE/UreJ family protein [bacterium AH-315-K03]